MDMPAPNPAILARKALLVERLSQVLPPEALISDFAELPGVVDRLLGAT